MNLVGANCISCSLGNWEKFGVYAAAAKSANGAAP